MLPARERSNTESGFTLVELLIYIAFAVVVLTLVGGMLVNALTAERSIVSRSQAITSGQLVSESVHAGVRNASRLQLTSTDTEQLLIAATVGGAEAVEVACQAWYYTAANDGAIYYQRVDQAVASIDAPRSSLDLQGWLLMGSGIAPLSPDSAVFTARHSRHTTESSSTIDAIDLGFAVAVGENSNPVLIESTTISRDITLGSNACF